MSPFPFFPQTFLVFAFRPMCHAINALFEKETLPGDANLPAKGSSQGFFLLQQLFLGGWIYFLRDPTTAFFFS